MKSFCSIFLLLLLCSGEKSDAAELVVNGGFESPKLLPSAGYATIRAVTNIGGWTLSAGSVDLVKSNFYASAEGSQSLDLNGDAIGSIYQDITTIPGEQYRLTFAFAGNPCDFCTPLLKQMEVKWGSTTVATLSQDVTGRSTTDMGWRRFAFLITGTGADRLSFRSLNSGTGGPALDQVSLVLASTPETFAGVGIQRAVQLSFPTVYGKTYQIQWATNLNSTVWTLLDAIVSGNGVTNTICDPRENPLKIYRVLQID